MYGLSIVIIRPDSEFPLSILIIHYSILHYENHTKTIPKLYHFFTKTLPKFYHFGGFNTGINIYNYNKINVLHVLARKILLFFSFFAPHVFQKAENNHTYLNIL
jgi:hypothetical protein